MVSPEEVGKLVGMVQDFGDLLVVVHGCGIVVMFEDDIQLEMVAWLLYDFGQLFSRGRDSSCELEVEVAEELQQGRGHDFL